MSDGYFGQFGPYLDDSRLQREHQARKAEMARQERAERWLVEHLRGRYDSFDSLVFAATKTLETLRGRTLDPDTLRVLTNACRAVWGGVAMGMGGRTSREINNQGSVTSVSIRAA